MRRNGKNGREPVIRGSAHTPQGKFLGALSSLSAAELGKVAVQAAVERSRIQAADGDEVILGNAVSAGIGQALVVEMES